MKIKLDLTVNFHRQNLITLTSVTVKSNLQIIHFTMLTSVAVKPNLQIAHFITLTSVAMQLNLQVMIMLDLAISFH